MTKSIWLYVGLGTLMMLLLGIVYVYSIFRVELIHEYGVSVFVSGLPYMFNLFFYALFMAIGGRLYQRINTNYVAVLGTVLIGGGFVLASLWHSIFGIVLTYGVMIGSGVGLLYGLPLRIVSQLTYSKPGLVTGIVLMGFGLSSVIFAPVVELGIETVGMTDTFLILGITYTVLLAGLLIPLTKRDQAPITSQKASYPMLKERSFYLIYGLFFIGTLIGLTFIGLVRNIGEDVIGLSAGEIALYIGLFSILNGIGRPLFGYLNDHIGFVTSGALAFSFVLLAVVMLFLSDGFVIFLLSFSLIYVTFGGWLSLAPSVTISHFGKANYSQNYGVMFTAYGLGALLGTGFGGLLIEWFSYDALYVMLGSLALLGWIILIWKQPLLSTKKS